MVHGTRRSVVIGAGAAAVAFGLGRRLEVLPAAQAQGGSLTAMNPKGLQFHRFSVGEIEVTQILDGAIERAHDPGFIRNASVEETKAALRAAGLPEDKVPNMYTVTVLRLGERLHLFDSGNGLAAGPNVGRLGENMRAAGLDPSRIDAIIVTHFHPDHIFGLMTKENAQVYADKEIIVPEAEYAFWTDPGVTAKLPEARQGLARRIQATFTGWKNIRRHSGEAEVVPGIRAVSTPGHTPGHTSYHVSSGNQQLMVLGDLTNIPALNLRNPGWHLAFDHDAQLAEATRRRMFDRIAADRITVTGYHWGMPGAGRVEKDGSGYVLVPVST